MTDLIGGALKIGVGLIAGGKRKKASKRAEAAVVESQKQALNFAQNQSDKQQANLKPYADAGNVGLGHLVGSLNADDAYATFKPENLDQDEGYRFRVEEGARALDRQANAFGRLFSGRQLRDAQDYGQKMALDEFGAARTRFNEDRDSRFTKRMGLATIGANAVTGQNSSLSDLAQYGTSSLLGQGQAKATGAQERGLIGAQTWANTLDGAMSMINAMGLPAGMPGGLGSIFKGK